MHPDRPTGEGGRMERRIRAAYAALKRQRSPWNAIGITLAIAACAGLCTAGAVAAYIAVRVLIGLFVGLWVFGLALVWVMHELGK
jgi:hypothetical protein